MAFPPRPGIKHKFRAVATEHDGIRFASKREAKAYADLMLEKRAGTVLFFLRQCPLHLPGGTRLVIDFIVFYADGSVRFLDAKGMETDSFRIKKREIEAVYPITIETI
jgi:hypothetical protein